MILVCLQFGHFSSLTLNPSFQISLTVSKNNLTVCIRNLRHKIYTKIYFKYYNKVILIISISRDVVKNYFVEASGLIKSELNSIFTPFFNGFNVKSTMFFR